MQKIDMSKVEVGTVLVETKGEMYQKDTTINAIKLVALKVNEIVDKMNIIVDILNQTTLRSINNKSKLKEDNNFIER